MTTDDINPVFALIGFVVLVVVHRRMVVRDRRRS